MWPRRKRVGHPGVHQELINCGYKVHIPFLGLDTEQIPPKGDPDRYPARRCVVESVTPGCTSSYSDWLRVEISPTYAPELNPPEYLFSALKGKDLANVPAVSVDHIAGKLEMAADRLADNAAIIQGFLRASTLFG